MNEIRVETLKKYYPFYGGILRRIKGWVKAVDGISFRIRKGEILGVVGESGCGKSTLGRAILRLVEPTEGKVFLYGTELTALSPSDLRKFRRKMQIIFQDPFSSLNPRMKVGEIIEEGLKIHRIGTSSERKRKVLELLEIVGLPADSVKRYPHEFSGGQRQRICIARAIALEPEFIVADEPTSSLDLSVQAQIIKLFMELREKLGLTYLFISHDLNLIRVISDFVLVMYLGRVFEYGRTEDILENPLHPYTKALISAVPGIEPETKRKRIILEGDVPDPASPPSGCYFHPRCPSRMEICRTSYPPLKEVNGRTVACHLY
jgi:oligopeptide/dipeptide ABC transporter ATP-binding protein